MDWCPWEEDADQRIGRSGLAAARGHGIGLGGGLKARGLAEGAEVVAAKARRVAAKAIRAVASTNTTSRARVAKCKGARCAVGCTSARQPQGTPRVTAIAQSLTASDLGTTKLVPTVAHLGEPGSLEVREVAETSEHRGRRSRQLLRLPRLRRLQQSSGLELVRQVATGERPHGGEHEMWKTGSRPPTTRQQLRSGPIGRSTSS